MSIYIQQHQASPSADRKGSQRTKLFMQQVQKTLTKVYKDLMVTRRELFDLRVAIGKTIRQMKELSTKIKPVCTKCNIPADPALPHRCKVIRFQCPHCANSFQSAQGLQIHQRNRHIRCGKCTKVHDENAKVHAQYLCAETMIGCEGCGISVKRKELDDHVKVCLYRTCYKCKNSIYAKAYAYHLLECNNPKSLITKCKKLPGVKPMKLFTSPSILPCSLVFYEAPAAPSGIF